MAYAVIHYGMYGWCEDLRDVGSLSSNENFVRPELALFGQPDTGFWLLVSIVGGAASENIPHGRCPKREGAVTSASALCAPLEKKIGRVGESCESHLSVRKSRLEITR